MHDGDAVLSELAACTVLDAARFALACGNGVRVELHTFFFYLRVPSHFFLPFFPKMHSMWGTVGQGAFFRFAPATASFSATRDTRLSESVVRRESVWS